jgi:succinate dehydrogenase/fumarate reductase cytochrome b subunit
MEEHATAFVSFYCWLLRSLLTAVLWVIYPFVLLYHVVRAIPHTTTQFTGVHTRMLRNVRLETAQNTSSTDTYIWFRNLNLKDIQYNEKRLQVQAMRFIIRSLTEAT